jgi:alpha-1,2-mannosyltransferase
LTLAFLRDAAWLTPGRLRAYATAMIVVTACVVAWSLMGHGIEDPAGRPVGTDFVSFWTVSWALLHGHSGEIYVPMALAALEQTALQRAETLFYAWQYPPIALLVVWPLALLPYLWSLAIWLAVGLAGYLTAMWRILPRPLTLWAALGFPGVMLTIVHGQNALLTTSLLGWALLLLWQRPIAAGVLIGMLTFKPQLGLLLPVALIAGGHWRAIVAAGLTALGLMAASALVFGAAIWRDFWVSTPFAHAMLDLGLVPYFKMQSVFAAARLLGGPPAVAYGVQAVVALGAAAIVAWVWRHKADPDLKCAAVAAATPLATPFFLDYDLMVIAPAIAWLAGRALRDGARPWEGTVLALAATLPLVSRSVAEYTGILPAPLVVALLVGAVVARVSGRPLRLGPGHPARVASPAEPGEAHAYRPAR